MAKLLQTKSLTYDDVTLLAQEGKVISRKDIKPEMARLVVSGMTSIICKPFIKAVSELPYKLQPHLLIPRDKYFEENLRYCKELNLKNIFVAIGLNTPKNVKLAKELGYNQLLIDVAWGMNPKLKELIPQLKEQGFHITCGSIHTEEGVNFLSNLETNIIRLGIGTSSSICSTRYVTGFYRGQISEILECAPLADSLNKVVMADGGFVYVGDYVKAFLAGAHFCLGGKLFTDCKEARLHIEGTGEYFGMSNPNKGISNSGFDESFCVKVPPASKTLKELINEIWQGISSGVSYSGYTSLTDAIGNGTFELKHNP